MTIHVTQEDIDTGQRNKPWACPVALAIKRAMPTHVVEAGPEVVYLHKPGDLANTAYHTPITASFFIENFDNGAPVSPFSFDLPVKL